MNRTKLFALAAGSFLLLAALAGAGNVLLSHRLSKTEKQLATLADSAMAAKLRAESDSANAALALERARAAEAVRDSLAAVSKAREAARKVAHARADSLVAVAPDTCQPVIEALQEELAAADALAGSYLEQYNVEVEEHERTKGALAQAAVDLGEAHQALARLEAAAGAIKVPSGRSFLSRLLPKAGVGCTAGMSPITARTDVVCGGSIGWEVSL